METSTGIIGWQMARRVLEIAEPMIAERDNATVQIELSDYEPLQRTTTDGAFCQIKSRLSIPYIRSH
jgi:hypothetical protein